MNCKTLADNDLRYKLHQLSCIKKTITEGGNKDEESKWPEIQDALIDAMNRLEKALSPYIPELRKL